MYDTIFCILYKHGIRRSGELVALGKNILMRPKDCESNINKNVIIIPVQLLIQRPYKACYKVRMK